MPENTATLDKPVSPILPEAAEEEVRKILASGDLNFSSFFPPKTPAVTAPAATKPASDTKAPTASPEPTLQTKERVETPASPPAPDPAVSQPAKLEALSPTNKRQIERVLHLPPNTPLSVLTKATDKAGITNDGIDPDKLRELSTKRWDGMNGQPFPTKDLPYIQQMLKDGGHLSASQPVNGKWDNGTFLAALSAKITDKQGNVNEENLKKLDTSYIYKTFANGKVEKEVGDLSMPEVKQLQRIMGLNPTGKTEGLVAKTDASGVTDNDIKVKPLRRAAFENFKFTSGESLDKLPPNDIAYLQQALVNEGYLEPVINGKSSVDGRNGRNTLAAALEAGIIDNHGKIIPPAQKLVNFIEKDIVRNFSHPVPVPATPPGKAEQTETTAIVPPLKTPDVKQPQTKTETPPR
jgi:hypothetical protein